MINILPHNQKKIVDKIRITRMVSITLWALTALGIVAGILMIPLFVAINTRFALVNQQIAALEQRGVVTRPVDVASLEQRVDTLSRKLTTKESPSPIEYLSTIRSIAPAGVTLAGFVFVPGPLPTVEVSGVATTRQTLQTFVSLLEGHEQIASVESPVSNYVKSTNSSFDLSVTFKPL